MIDRPSPAPKLVHVPADGVIAWQWHAELKAGGTIYVAGFKTEAAAREYGRRHKWCP